MTPPPVPRSLPFHVLFALCSAFLVPRSSWAGLPQPMVVYYGQARDGFGWPYKKDATVVLLRGTSECARCAIRGSRSPGVNFALYVPLDDARDTNRYVRSAVRTGETVSIVVDDLYGRKTIMESNAVPCVTAPGDLILVNVTAGSDTDGDGLPDEWEQEMVDWGFNPDIASIWDVRGADDYDGDGQSNAEEYRAGTFAFLDYDYFFAERFALTAGGRMKIEFLSVAGKVYSVQACTNLVVNRWEDCAYSPSDGGALQSGPREGDGGWMSFYVTVLAPEQAFKLEVR
jgi:hypothetical protein